MAAVRTGRLRERRERLEAQLTALREAEREEEERRHAIVGRIALEHAERDERFRDELTALLDRALTKKRERRLFDLPVSSRSRRRGAAEPAAAAPSEPGAFERTGTGE